MALISLLRTEDLDDLCAFLRAAHVHVDAAGGASIEASIPGSASDVHERRELAGYVATWNALNPGRHAELVERAV